MSLIYVRELIERVAFGEQTDLAELREALLEESKELQAAPGET